MDAWCSSGHRGVKATWAISHDWRIRRVFIRSLYVVCICCSFFNAVSVSFSCHPRILSSFSGLTIFCIHVFSRPDVSSSCCQCQADLFAGIKEEDLVLLVLRTILSLFQLIMHQSINSCIIRTEIYHSFLLFVRNGNSHAHQVHINKDVVTHRPSHISFIYYVYFWLLQLSQVTGECIIFATLWISADLCGHLQRCHCFPTFIVLVIIMIFKEVYKTQSSLFYLTNHIHTTFLWCSYISLDAAAKWQYQP